MKKLAWVLGILLLILIILIGGLSLYLTDERLRSMILPEIREATGRDVQMEHISYSLFRTFPQFGLVIEGLEVPDPTEERLARVDRILLSLNIMPLISGEISVHYLEIDRPEFTYIIYEDESTNLDSFLPEVDPDADEPFDTDVLMDLDLAEIRISNASLGMVDHSTESSFELSGLDMVSSLRFTEVLHTTMDVTLENLTIVMEGRRLVTGLGFQLTQTSELDLQGENLNVMDGRLNLHGLGLTLEGNISEWGGGEPLVNLEIASESDDFGALLDLVPPDFEEYIADLDTGGELDLSVTLQGRFREDEVPDFNGRASIVDGFIQHTDVPERISGISLSAHADNELVTIETFEATAGETRLSASGEIRQPLEESATFAFNGSMNADLSTADRYIPLEEFDIQELSGLVEVIAEASGDLWKPEEAHFDIRGTVSNGRIAHTEIARPVEDIAVELHATHEEITVTSASARSSANHINASGSLTSPLEPENATFRASGDINIDLATIADYYPIDTDTLDIRGMISLSGTSEGYFEDPGNATFSVEFDLADGFVAYHQIDRNIEELTATASANQQTLTIEDARVHSGSNRFSMSGSISDYMEESAAFDLSITGLLALDEMNAYYPLEEELGLTMNGTIDSGARFRGQIDDLESIRIDGSLVASNVNMDAPELFLPLSELNGNLQFSGNSVTAEEITFYFGESDYFVSGNMQNYKALMYEPDEAEPAQFNGRFHSEFFNADEFLDFEEPPEDFEPEPFEAFLPNLAGSFDAEIERLQFFGMEATDARGTLEMTPHYIGSDHVDIAIFDGTMDGSFRWDILAVDHTAFSFEGNLDRVRVEALFGQLDFGGQSSLDEHVRADFSANTNFYAEFDEYFEMDMHELFATGDFGMQQARIQDHPVQASLAGLLGIDELRNLALDSWTAIYHIEDGIMQLDDFNLTSRELGLNLSGSQSLIEDELDYRAQIVLPGDWAGRLGGTIPSEGAEALKRDDGKLVLPTIIRGSSENPQPRLDMEFIQNQVEQYLREQARDAGRDVLDGILDRMRD